MELLPKLIILVAVTTMVSVELCDSKRTSNTKLGHGLRYPYVEKYFDQFVDHFNWEKSGNATFKQRYFYTDDYFVKGGPIFFYTGNEGPIEAFFDNTGFVFDIAPEFNALVVFAEHRYYGKTLPFGNDSFVAGNLGLLTIEQALADYAALITWLKTSSELEGSPVVLFGGSYGGMLSAYMRFKYPHVVIGALAASAPVFSAANESNSQTFFFDAVTKDFHDVDAKCPDIVRAGFKKIRELADTGAAGLKTISDTFRLCKPLASKDDVYHLLGWVRNSFTFQAMLDYPYQASFMGSLPANPVNVSCHTLLNASSPIQGLAKAAAIYYNSSSSTPLKCFDIFAEFVECADPTGCGLGTDSIAWDYQACTEVLMPAGSNNVTDMFPSMPFTAEMRAAYCQKKYGVTPRGDWLRIQGFGRGLAHASNIIFSNGLLDPWRPGGVTETLSDTLVAIPISHGAHHLDLRASDPKDPESVVQVRSQEKLLIKTWIDTWRLDRRRKSPR